MCSCAVGKDKDKDKEALFNVAYNVTDNISSRAILRHNNYIFNRYLPVFISLAQPLFMRASARELLVPFLHLWYGAAAGFEHVHDNSSKDTSSNTTFGRIRQLVECNVWSKWTVGRILFFVEMCLKFV